MERNYLRRLYKKRPPNVSARVEDRVKQAHPEPQTIMTEETKKPEPQPQPEPQPEKKVEKQVEKEAEIVSIHDFKSMLVGMDLVLGDEWTPTAEQWKRIRKKLDALIETAERPRGAAAPSSFPQVNNPLPPVDPNPNISESDLLRNFPAVPGGVPENVPVGQLGPAGPSALTPPQRAPQPQRLSPRAPMATHEGEQVKTPDIDSSKGYKSSFV